MTMETEKTTHLLKNLMPSHVFQQMKDGKEIVDEIKDCTLVFADIKGFTDYSSGKEPQAVVEMLSGLFARFDRSCKANDCYKVHTIGDCYVALSFTGFDGKPRIIAKEAARSIKFGFSMIDIINVVKKEINFEGLNMRIGVHTGEIFAGIVGSDIVRYDIYGSNVLTANKMESSGIPGEVCISHTTYLELTSKIKEFGLDIDDQ